MENNEATVQLSEAWAKMAPPTGENMRIRTNQLVDGYSTFFAETCERDNDLIVHLFARAGADDQWEPGHYLAKCKACGRDRPDVTNSKVKPCEACGHVGLVYVPGRTEGKVSVVWACNRDNTTQLDVKDRIKQAIDGQWAGEVAIEHIPELDAYVLQVQGGANLAVKEKGEMLDRFFNEFDQLLE